LTPDGPGTIRLAAKRYSDTETDVEARVWGPGADWLLGTVPDLLGDRDDWDSLDVSGSEVLTQVLRRHPGVRLCRTNLVLESLVPACLEQRVTGQEAFGAYRHLVHRFGERAPGPDDDAAPRLWVAPGPEQLLRVPDWDWHRMGVDPRRYKAIRACATVANRLEECVEHDLSVDLDAPLRRLRHVPGVGEWTAAETAVRALGHPDAVSVGDFHLKNHVGYVLTGAARSTDEEMVELLEPWKGQRARVVRLIELSGLGAPKFGPRFNYNDIRVI
jgi:3-methyladenine DNA glycosylase/8-oxoguanine DNA glycosylase